MRLPHKITPISDTELVLIIPSSFATGEPGDPLSREVKELIAVLTQCAYWPLEFGEDNGNSIELLFHKAFTPTTAHEMAEHFIKMGGDV